MGMNVLASPPFVSVCSAMINWRTSDNITRTAAYCNVYHSHSSGLLLSDFMCVYLSLLGTICFLWILLLVFSWSFYVWLPYQRKWVQILISLMAGNVFFLTRTEVAGSTVITKF